MTPSWVEPPPTETVTILPASGAPPGPVSAAVTVLVSPKVPLTGGATSVSAVAAAAVPASRWYAPRLSSSETRPSPFEAWTMNWRSAGAKSSRPFQSCDSSSVPHAAGSGATHCWRSSGAHVPAPVVKVTQTEWIAAAGSPTTWTVKSTPPAAGCASTLTIVGASESAAEVRLPL